MQSERKLDNFWDEDNETVKFYTVLESATRFIRRIQRTLYIRHCGHLRRDSASAFDRENISID